MSSDRSPEPKILVRARALKTLLEWCSDAIDFRDETDAQVAEAFDQLTTDAGSPL